MQTTTRIMNLHRNKNTRNLSWKELSSLYKQTHEEYIIAEAWIKLEALLRSLNKKYPNIDTQDKISYAMEDLVFCLSNYNENINCQFTTYYSKIYLNRLRHINQLLNTHKRCIIFNSLSLDYLISEGRDYPYNPVNNLISLPNTLSENERIYCYLLAMNYGTNTEIAKKMNLTTMALCKMRKRLRVKLQTSLYN